MIDDKLFGLRCEVRLDLTLLGHDLRQKFARDLSDLVDNVFVVGFLGHTCQLVIDRRIRGQSLGTRG